MLPSWLARVWTPLRPALTPSTWPSQCLICRSWQRNALCEGCRHLWMPNQPRCLRCAIGLPNKARNAGICASCEDRSPEFDRAIAAVDYAGPWPALLARLKFSRHTGIAQNLAMLMAQAIETRQANADLIVPVPLSPQRLTERGFNQSWLLTKALSKALSTAARHDVLARTRHTQRLMSLDAQARRDHILEAFAVTPAGMRSIRQRHVAIVDDVMTTGATLDEAARTLLDAGARSVSAWVVARTPSPSLATSPRAVPEEMGFHRAW